MCFFNRRLKNALITAAKNFVRFNPDHHLTGDYTYLINVIKKNMKKTEAYKRVTRSLVRVIFIPETKWFSGIVTLFNRMEIGDKYFH